MAKNGLFKVVSVAIPFLTRRLKPTQTELDDWRIRGLCPTVLGRPEADSGYQICLTPQPSAANQPPLAAERNLLRFPPPPDRPQQHRAVSWRWLQEDTPAHTSPAAPLNPRRVRFTLVGDYAPIVRADVATLLAKGTIKMLAEHEPNQGLGFAAHTPLSRKKPLSLYLWFAVRGHGYQYAVLPFRLAQSPRAFRKVVEAALVPPWEHGVRILNYLTNADLPGKQAKESGSTKVISEAPGAYGICSRGNAARIASYDTASALAFEEGFSVYLEQQILNHEQSKVSPLSAFCWACRREWPRTASTTESCTLPNCALRAALLSVKLISEPQSSVKGCPYLRACPGCHALLTHSGEGCPNIICPQCNEEFCFRCLRSECYDNEDFDDDDDDDVEPEPCVIVDNTEILQHLEL
ncbi:E3 ubiquitin-protein ligase ARIH2-like [Pimephales promelas]|nr:E3 ubiquitin-protein ligase ARIH2-like [Pimephales promelas]